MRMQLTRRDRNWPWLKFGLRSQAYCPLLSAFAWLWFASLLFSAHAILLYSFLSLSGSLSIPLPLSLCLFVSFFFSFVLSCWVFCFVSMHVADLFHNWSTILGIGGTKAGTDFDFDRQTLPALVVVAVAVSFAVDYSSCCWLFAQLGFTPTTTRTLAPALAWPSTGDSGGTKQKRQNVLEIDWKDMPHMRVDYYEIKPSVPTKLLLFVV